MNKAELIRHEIEKRRAHNLAIGNPLFTAMAEEDIELLSFIDSLQEEPVSNDLEEASKNYALNNTPWDDCKDEIQESFKAGAKWQKEQMIKEAINGIARPDDGEVWCDLKPFNLKDGDKVKVIVIKED